MDKFEQIVKLADAAALIDQVIRANPQFANQLQEIADNIANTADEIEGA